MEIVVNLYQSKLKVYINIICILIKFFSKKELFFEESFASHHNSYNEKVPRNILKNSRKKYLFVCEECKHIFQISLCDIENGLWCSYC